MPASTANEVWYPPPPCRSPPLVVPRGGVGDRHLVNPKFFVAAHCVVVGCHYHLHPLHSWQDILLTFAEMELDSTTMFPPGTSVMFIRSTGEPVLAQVVGHSEHGDAYRRITYDRDGKTVLHDRASVRRLSLPRAPSPPRPALGVWSPMGGGGPSLGDHPPGGGGGPSSLGWGTTRGGEGIPSRLGRQLRRSMATVQTQQPHVCALLPSGPEPDPW